ncbi:hypothetical protein [Aestuariibaculum sediminum]|uniref:Uncharacterized protein n=1 Tax=Aestuariibaculum sediminum TaxID=2770637 RepID=A0A8J6Q0N4_9FLAO|nr:hypothetical protein [Aestuariibaculum sediminum]MBD0833333.1 hypothetical protein [Aestuariibaculum sediminum]
MQYFLLYLDDATMVACEETTIGENAHVYWNYYVELQSCGGISGNHTSDPDHVFTGTGYTTIIVLLVL